MTSSAGSDGAPDQGTAPRAPTPPPQFVPARGPFRLAIGLLCATMLAVMIFLTAADVIGRYLLSRPILGASEVTEVLLVLTVYIGLIAVCLDQNHVTVDLLVDRFPRALQPARRILVGLLTAGVLGTVAWRLWIYGGQFASYGGTTNSLRIPLAPVVWICAACAALGAVATLVLLFRNLKYRH